MEILKLFVGVAIITAAVPGQAETVLQFKFVGEVQPFETARVANQIDGIVSEINFAPGDQVAEGQVMFKLADDTYRIEVEAARAVLAEAVSRQALADDIASRQAELKLRGAGAEARATQSRLNADIAKAAVARAAARLQAAELSLARTRIKSPIAGRAQRRVVELGAFVEAEGGTVLGEVIKTDPVLVAYKLTYDQRQKALAAARTTSISELFGRIELSLRLPSGEIYNEEGQPKFESANLDPETKMLTTWAEFPNPDNLLIPGLDVEIVSRISGSRTGDEPSQ